MLLFFMPKILYRKYGITILKPKMNLGLGQILLISFIALLFFGNFPKIINNLRNFFKNLKK